MGWKGALRSMEAAGRRAEREAKRQHNALLQQQKHLQKMLERERAAFEVQSYENRIDLLRSIHKDCGPIWDWRGVYSSSAPAPPTNSQNRTNAARSALDRFKPTFWDKLFRRVESKRKRSTLAVEQAEKADANEYLEAVTNYEKEMADWQERREIASRVLAGNLQSFKEVIEEIGPFREVSDLGSGVGFGFRDTSVIEVTLKINDQNVIPSETKSLLQSGKLSTKRMPQGQFYNLYQDYICGCVLRIAREIFALLPFEIAIVTALGDIVNAQTGHLEEKPLLSVAIPRRTLDKLDLNTIDPSESMKNFIHHMDFKKNNGFQVIARIEPTLLSGAIVHDKS